MSTVGETGQPGLVSDPEWKTASGTYVTLHVPARAPDVGASLDRVRQSVSFVEALARVLVLQGGDRCGHIHISPRFRKSQTRLSIKALPLSDLSRRSCC